MSFRRIFDRSLAGAVLSGVLLALAFPKPDLGFFAWIGLVPLLLTGRGEHCFRNAFVTGVVFFSLTLYWLNIVMTLFGRLPLVLSLAAFLLLVAYLSLFIAAAFWLAWRWQQRRGWSLAWTFPIAWVGFEFVRAHLLSGFPWASLGYSQQALLPVIQSADLFGVYGLSFLLVLSNCLLAEAWAGFKSTGSLRRPVLLLTILVGLFAGNLGYGYWRLHQPWQGDKSLRVALVQGNIDQGVKWDPAYQWQTVERYRSLTEAAAESGRLDMVIWPESATPFYFQEPGPKHDLIWRIPRETGTHLLFGSPAYQREDGHVSYLNSAFLLSPNGEVLGRSDKVHLVPFGEYVPFKRLLPFVQKLAHGIGDFSPGEVMPLSLNGHQLGVLVCYEVIFPELARDYVNQGADLLVNITNDAWFGRSSAPFQHLAMARFRAIENRTWLARAANTGISAFISPTGVVTAQSDLFVAMQLTGRVATGAHSTWYRASGDLLPIVCLVLSLGGVIALRPLRRRTPA